MYSRWALILGSALIQINAVHNYVLQFFLIFIDNPISFQLDSRYWQNFSKFIVIKFYQYWYCHSYFRSIIIIKEILLNIIVENVLGINLLRSLYSSCDAVF